MVKYRKAFFEIEKALMNDAYGVITLIGLRKTGKTTILKQLAEKYHGYYLDFKASKDPDNDYLDLYEREENLVLLDEIGYLPGFDAYFTNLERDIKSVGKKVVITSSSYGTLKQLASENLGGGRSHTTELFPLSFEEYLYFSGVITDYGEEYEPAEQDLQNFYRLINVPAGMDFVIDKEYFDTVFTDIEVARANSLCAVRDVYLEKKHYASVLDIIAYTLNYPISIKRFQGARIASQEFGKEVKGLPISESLISLANNIVNKMTSGSFRNIGVPDLAYIIAYLYHSGFLFVDLRCDEQSCQSIDRIKHDLYLVKGLEDFTQVLSKYTFSVISPLLYTRLMINLEDIAGKLCNERSIFGQLYELSIKCEVIYKNGYDRMHYSYKYKIRDIEVDLWQNNLLLEASISNKDTNSHSVDKVLADYQVIRVLTDYAGKFSFNGVYYVIGYPKALLMISNGTIFYLQDTKVETVP